MSAKYDEYLNNHIRNVGRGLSWLIVQLPEVLDGFDSDYLGELISNHDKSKWNTEEYDAYDKYFYSDEDVTEEFDKAWLHHQHNNPHHWQHWLLHNDDGSVTALEMPKEYVIEMFCDHWAFSWAKNNFYEIFDWYADNKAKMILHANTQAFYEDILSKLKTRLDEVQADGSQ